MESLGEKKSHLEELESQKFRLEEQVREVNRRLKMSLIGTGVGILLVPLFWLVGVPVIVVAGITALVYFGQQTRFKDKLESLETEIHKLEISMA
jgi:hypothetical protein